MLFKLIQSSLDGLCGGDATFPDVKSVLERINYFKGWESKKQLHDRIKAWAKKAEPGSVFLAPSTAVIAVAISPASRTEDYCPRCETEEADLEYGEFSGTEGGGIEQRVTCPKCGKVWMDVFVLAEQRELSGG